MNEGQKLNLQFQLGAAQSLFGRNGKWFHVLERFPGVLCDPNGYVMYKTRQEYETDPHLQRGKELNVRGGISAIPGYVRFPVPVSSLKESSPSLLPITSAEEILHARNVMAASLAADCQTFERVVGWQGGNLKCDVHWNSHAKFWFVTDILLNRNRWIFFFGTEDPQTSPTLNITCEINMPKEGINRRCAGLFIRDVTNNAVYLTHSGKLGGGKSGVGKSEFWANYLPGKNHCSRLCGCSDLRV